MGNGDAQRLCHIAGGPAFQHKKIKHLKLLNGDPAFHSLNGRIHEVLLPFVVPGALPLLLRLVVGHPLHQWSLSRVVRRTDGCWAARALLKLICNLGTGDGEQPRFESALAWIILELRDALGYREHSLLDNFLSFLVRQPTLNSEVVDELPVSIEKLSPALVVLPVLQPAQQAFACREQVFRAIVRWLTVSRHSVAIRREGFLPAKHDDD